MLLAFDVGNTNIVLGVFKNGKLITNWRMETDNRKSADEYGMIINQLFEYEELSIDDISDVIIATVVPSILYTLQHLSMKYFHRKAIVIGPGIKTGLIIKYDNPKQVGADRIVNAAAAIEGSTKYLVSELLIAVFDLRFGFQAGVSSITKSFLNAKIYERSVFSLKVSASPARTSRNNEATVASDDTLPAYALKTRPAFSGSLSTSSTLDISDSISPSK